MGLDLGQASDYTALAIIERLEAQTQRLEYEEIVHEATPDGLRGGRLSEMGPFQRALRADEAMLAAHAAASPYPPLVEYRQKVVTETVIEYHLRHLVRPALGMPYTEIVRHVVELMEMPELRGAPLVIDRTGVGRAVYDMFAYARMHGSAVGVTITGGDTVISEGNGYRVPKRDLVSALQVLLQQKRLKIAQGLALGSVFAAEALNFKAKISERGHDSYEAGPAADWRDGAHDDLVLAVALACWYAERPQSRIRFFD